MPGPEYDNVERPFMDHLTSLGWNIVLSEDDLNKFRPRLTKRYSFDEVLIESRLKQSLEKLNPWMNEEQITDVVNEIKRIGVGKSLVEANKDFIELLLEKPVVIQQTDAGRRNTNVTVIDFDHPEKNDFCAMNQFRVNTPDTSRPYIIPDIVLFVNGIPLVVVECKYQDDVDANPMEEGIDQLKRYSNSRKEVRQKEGSEKLFQYNLMMVSTTFEEARIGTITSEYDHFLEWKDIYPKKLDITMSSQQRLIEGSLNKHALLDLLQNFTIFMEVEGKRIKIVGRYHQYRAVNKIIARIMNNQTPEERSGVVWHTQGSGKSLSMVFLIRKIRSIDSLKQMKVVIITDRINLEGQLSGTAGLAEKPYQMANTKKLITELKTDTSNLVMALTQKFLKRGKGRRRGTQARDLLPTYEQFEVLNRSEDILLLVDEAHRSQSGTFGANIAKALPKSTKIAFTGTPLITKKARKRKSRTIDLFGTYIDKYGMKQSIADGATLQIRYEGKTVSTKVGEKNYMDIEFEDMFKERTEEEKAWIRKKYGTKRDVLEAETRIRAISKDIVHHYFENVFDNGFKAQIVASSRLAAYRYKLAIDAELTAYIQQYEQSNDVDQERLDRMKFLKSVVRITYQNNDDPDLRELAKAAKTDLGVDNINFKSKFDVTIPNSGIGFLVVKDMLLTGFDAPIEQVLYVDKKMQDHTLLQAIARVNRVNTGKDFGYVVDYFGILNHLDEALGAYRQEDLQLEFVFTDIRKEFKTLEKRYQDLLSLFLKLNIPEIEDYVNYRIQNKAEQLRILENCILEFDDVKARAEFHVKFRLFLRSMDVLLSKQGSDKYIPPLMAFSHIHRRTMLRYRDSSINILGAGKKVRRLIDKHLETLGIDTQIDPVDIFSDTFEHQVKKIRSKRSQASEMEHAIRKHCKVKLDIDPVFYKKISDKLEDILRQFEDNWEEQLKLFKKLIEEMKRGREKDDTGLDPDRHGPYFDLIVGIISEDDGGIDEVKNSSIRGVKLMIDVLDVFQSHVDFWSNPEKQKHCRAELNDILIELGTPIFIEHRGQIIREIMNLAKKRSEVI